MSSLDKQAALLVARDYLQSAKGEITQKANEDMLRLRHDWLLRDHGPTDQLGREIPPFEERAATMILRAQQGEPFAAEMLDEKTGELIRAGKKMPLVLRKYVADSLGKLPATGRRGRKPGENTIRDLHITCAVGLVVRLGFPATRNRATSPDSPSACDIVAEAAGKDFNVSGAGVEKIWNGEWSFLR